MIACFNFINLATARSFRRAKEIGVRKVVGADRKQLILQFIGETILLSVFSMIIAVVATFLIVPLLNQFTGKSIEFNPFTNPVLALIILTVRDCYWYYRRYLSCACPFWFSTDKSFKKHEGYHGTRGAWLRQALVVIQFSLSVLLIVSTTIVYRQTKFLNNKDLGFNKEQVVYFQVRDSLASNLKRWKHLNPNLNVLRMLFL